jgi:enoyl-CoA hydratase/carnithine racemase
MERTDLGPVLYEVDGAVARLVLNWPEKANAQSSEMVRAFDQALDLADRDYDVRVLVIKANGNGFCAGHAVGGIDAYPEFAENREHWNSVWKAQADLFLWPTIRLWEFRKPTVAQVHGYALGGGTYWALLPDITIASEDAYFQMPLVQGLAFPGGETMIEPWVFMNWKRAYEYLYTAQTVTAYEALEMGMVNRVVARDELEATVEQLAEHIARAPLSTLMATKQLVSRAWELMGMRMHWQMSTDVMAVTASTKDAQAARMAMASRGQKPSEAAARPDAPASGSDA